MEGRLPWVRRAGAGALIALIGLALIAGGTFAAWQITRADKP